MARLAPTPAALVASATAILDRAPAHCSRRCDASLAIVLASDPEDIWGVLCDALADCSGRLTKEGEGLLEEGDTPFDRRSAMDMLDAAEALDGLRTIACAEYERDRIVRKLATDSWHTLAGQVDAARDAIRRAA